MPPKILIRVLIGRLAAGRLPVGLNAGIEHGLGVLLRDRREGITSAVGTAALMASARVEVLPVVDVPVAGVVRGTPSVLLAAMLVWRLVSLGRKRRRRIRARSGNGGHGTPFKSRARTVGFFMVTILLISLKPRFRR